MATILNNRQSTGGSPYAFYTVEAQASNRTSNSVNIQITVKGHLQYSSSSLGTGQSMGLRAYLTFNGVEISDYIELKGTGESWSGTTEHSASKTYTITGLRASATAIGNVKVRVTRTGTAEGDYSSGAALSSTDCSNIGIPIGQSKLKTKVNNTWIDGLVYVKVNGEWKEATGTYVKVNDVWKECSL